MLHLFIDTGIPGFHRGLSPGTPLTALASFSIQHTGHDTRMLHLFIDADACPVKEEAYRVAKRNGFTVSVVANQWMNMPNDPNIRLEVVDDGFDAADDWIVDYCERGDVVITEDIPLASRCIAKGARVLTGRGRIHDENSIGGALAARELMQYLRESGTVKGGQKPMNDQDRREFAMELEKMMVGVRKVVGAR